MVSNEAFIKTITSDYNKNLFFGLWIDGNLYGEYLDENYKLDVNFELWIRFFERENLSTTTAPLAGFRKRPDQKSAVFQDEYLIEVQSILKNMIPTIEESKKLKNLKLIGLIKNIQYSRPHKKMNQIQISLMGYPSIVRFNFE